MIFNITLSAMMDLEDNAREHHYSCIILQSDQQDGSLRLPEHNKQLTFQDFLCPTLLLRIEHHLGWLHSLHLL